MSKQKIVILVLSIIGLASTFLPWVKGFLVGTVVGISGPSVNMDIIWLVIILFLVPILICLISKQEHLRRQTLFWSILPPLVSALIAFFVFCSRPEFL